MSMTPKAIQDLLDELEVVKAGAGCVLGIFAATPIASIGARKRRGSTTGSEEKLMLPKCLHTFSKILAVSAFSSCLPVMAQEKTGGLYDFLGSKSDATEPDAQRVYEVLLKMLDRWNAHDIEGHLEAYWKSPELLVMIDAEQFNGWQQLHDSYVNGYPDRSAMGFIEPGRIQVRLLKPDLALALTWWTINFPSSNRKLVGNTTMNLQKFDDGWRIVASHTSTGGTYFPATKSSKP